MKISTNKLLFALFILDKLNILGITMSNTYFFALCGVFHYQCPLFYKNDSLNFLYAEWIASMCSSLTESRVLPVRLK